ncbi:MAG: hypothetical protein R3294_15600, partial [Arenibacter troitsensis]|nr:hypothetical protein [Arenibacter troitsensis]
MGLKTMLHLGFYIIQFLGVFVVSAQNTLNPSELKEDFQLFRKALEESHPGIYRYAAKSSMDGSFESIGTELDQPLTQQEFY